MFHAIARNHPQKLEGAMTDLKSGMPIDIDVLKSRVIPEKLEYALLKTAYVMLFERFGYAFVLDKCYDIVGRFKPESDQLFLTGKEIKEDLIKIAQAKLTHSDVDPNRAHSEPPRIKELLIYKIWNQMLLDWPPDKDWVPSQEEIEMMQKVVTNLEMQNKLTGLCPTIGYVAEQRYIDQFIFVKPPDDDKSYS